MAAARSCKPLTDSPIYLCTNYPTRLDRPYTRNHTLRGRIAQGAAYWRWPASLKHYSKSARPLGLEPGFKPVRRQITLPTISISRVLLNFPSHKFYHQLTIDIYISIRKAILLKQFNACWRVRAERDPLDLTTSTFHHDITGEGSRILSLNPRSLSLPTQKRSSWTKHFGLGPHHTRTLNGPAVPGFCSEGVSDYLPSDICSIFVRRQSSASASERNN
jgi:hypothetical protein